MSETLEAELRAAFAERAHDVPAQAVDRLRRIDYRPRSRTLRPRVAVGAGAALAATGGAVVALVGLGAGASPAFAGWSATPTAPTSGETSGALQQCTAQLAGMQASGLPTGGWQPVLTDTRGPFTAMVLSSDGTSATCFTGPSFTTVNESDAQGAEGSASQRLSAGSATASSPASVSVLGLGSSTTGPISRATQSHLTTNTGQPYTFVQGQVSTDVTSVKLLLSDGTNVEATVAEGSFVAWWPGNTDATSAQIATPSGVTTQQLTFTPLPAPNASPTDATSGSASSSS
jgi:hypothetical protein